MINKNTPEIRFPGYIGDWVERKIGELLKESRISGTNGLEAKKLTVKLWGKGVIPKDEIYQGSEATKYYIRKAGQFIYGKLDFLHQAFGLIPDKLDGYESTLDSPAFDIADKLNSFFFLEYVSRKQFYLYQGTIANGSRKAKRIHSETFLEMPLIVPTSEEQSKVGNFFKKLDETIALHQQELTTLKQIKQGFLQKMFPKEGESLPELRFPGFTGDWEQSKLGELIEISSAARVHKDEWTTSGVRFFRSSDVVSKFNGKKNTQAFISYSLYDELSKKTGVVQPGDILITGGGSIGIPYLVVDREPLYFKDADLIWFKSANKIDGYFLYSYFVTPQIRRYISSITHIGTISHYTIEQAKDTPILLPEQLEQTQIGNFFIQLDETIALHQTELDALKETKKAFLQKMFV